MLCQLALKLRRLTYWQWALVGMALMVAISLWESWWFYRRAIAFRNLANKVSFQIDEQGPAWLRDHVPEWFRDSAFNAPRSAILNLHGPDSDILLAELQYIPTLRDLLILNDKGCSRHQARLIGRMTNLQRLSVTLQDSELHELAMLTELRQLDIGGGPFSESGLRALRPMKRLQELSLGDIDDHAIAALADLPQLEVLDLSGTRISDAGLRYLEGNTQLRCLRLNSTNITNDGLIILSKLPALRRLNLQQTKIDDEGTPHLVQFPKLQDLNLRQTTVSDASIPQLIQIKNLHLLEMIGSNVTYEGHLRFARACPNVILPLPRL